jgi:cyanate permease
MLAALAGGAAGPWATGALHDWSGNYVLAFWFGLGLSGISALAVWRAAPRNVRAVAGRTAVRRHPAQAR